MLLLLTEATVEKMNTFTDWHPYPHHSNVLLKTANYSNNLDSWFKTIIDYEEGLENLEWEGVTVSLTCLLQSGSAAHLLLEVSRTNYALRLKQSMPIIFYFQWSSHPSQIFPLRLPLCQNQTVYVTWLWTLFVETDQQFLCSAQSVWSFWCCVLCIVDKTGDLSQSKNKQKQIAVLEPFNNLCPLEGEPDNQIKGYLHLTLFAHHA